MLKEDRIIQLLGTQQKIVKQNDKSCSIILFLKRERKNGFDKKFVYNID